MLVAYLLMKRKIVKMMSGYQVLRSTLQFLGEFPGAFLVKKKPERSGGRGNCGFSLSDADTLGVGWTGEDEAAEWGWMEQLAEE